MIVSGSNLDVKVCAMSVQVSWIEKYRCIPCIFYIYVTTEDVIEWYSPTDMISDGFQEPAKKLGVSVVELIDSFPCFSIAWRHELAMDSWTMQRAEVNILLWQVDSKVINSRNQRGSGYRERTFPITAVLLIWTYSAQVMWPP